jgi:hypothetical protein
MAGDWIKFEKATIEKPEVYEMAGILEMDPDAVIGKLLRVWSWFDTQSENGNAKCNAIGNAHVTVCALLNRIVGVTQFTDAMVQVGWLEIDDQIVKIPNFERHNGKSAKTRALTARRVGKLRKSNANGNAMCNASGNDSVTKVALAREEKRREDIYTPIIPSGDEKKTVSKKGSKDELEGFDRWWAVYPKKVAKPKAEAAWRKVMHGKGSPSVEELVAAVNAHRKTREWLEGYVPNPATWLNGCRWTDEISAESNQSPPSGETGGLARTAAERAEALLAGID